jgi:hypothetical protein
MSTTELLIELVDLNSFNISDLSSAWMILQGHMPVKFIKIMVNPIDMPNATTITSQLFAISYTHF